MIYLILLLSLILRLVNLNQSFWLDEAAQVSESIRPFTEQFNIVADFHPPLYHLLLHFWMHLGITEVWVRLLSVIFSLGSIFVLYKLIIFLGNKKEALLASFFLALSPYHIWYAQETRPYMLFTFLSLLSTLLMLQKKWFSYLVFIVLTLYSLYFAPLLIIGHLAYIYFFDRKNLLKFIKVLFLAALFLLPWMPQLLHQLQVGLNGSFYGWKDVVSISADKVVLMTLAKFIFGKGSIDNNLIYGLVILPVFVIFIASLYISYRNNQGKKLITFFVIPLILSFIISIFIPIVAPQRLIFLLPIFAAIIAKGVNRLPKTWFYISILLVVGTNICGIIQYYSNPYVQREQWRQAVSYVENNGDDKSVVIFVFPTSVASYLWYQKNPILTLGIAPDFLLKDEDLLRIRTQLVNKNKVFLFQYLTGLTDPNEKTMKFLINNNFQHADTIDYPGVGFIYIFINKETR